MKGGRQEARRAHGKQANKYNTEKGRPVQRAEWEGQGQSKWETNGKQEVGTVHGRQASRCDTEKVGGCKEPNGKGRDGANGKQTGSRR